MKKVLLYSGGLDSWLVNELWKPDVKLYVNLHTKYAQQELSKLPPDVVIEDLDLSHWERTDAILPLRNLYLVAIATNYGDEICLGATAGDRVLDQSYGFARKAEDLLSYLYQKQMWTNERTIKVNVSFREHTKTHLLRMFLDQGGDINKAFAESFSCYSPINGQECWGCEACARKYIAFVNNGFTFNEDVKRKMKKYIENEIVPFIEAKEYGRGDEEYEVMNALKQE